MMLWFKTLQRYTGKSAIIACFILCALPVGLLSALITPPGGQAPDEPAHLARAAGLLHGVIIGVRKNMINPQNGKEELWTGLKVDAGIAGASWGSESPIAGRAVVTTPDFQAMRAEPADHHRIFLSLPNTATYFPTAYIPATLGLALGLAVKAPPYACFLLARIFMLAAFMLLGAATLWITAFGEAALFTILILPMTLFLAGTVNQDAVLIAMVCLACAAMTQGTRGFRVLGLVVFALFLGSKPPYILLFAAFLLPLFGAGFWRRVRDVAIASMPVLLWIALIAAFVVVPFDKPPYHPGPFYTGDRSVWMDHDNTAINLHILLSHPSRLITLPWQAIELWGPQRLQEMVGVLGARQILLATSYYYLWYCAGLIALLGLVISRRPSPISPRNAVVNFFFISFLLVLTYWLINIMAYLDWTNVGQDSVEGLQGRYILPLVPFLLFAIPGFRWRFTVPPLLPALPSVALGIYDLGYVPMKLVWNYYLH